MVRERNGFTVPWLDLDPGEVHRFARGQLGPAPKPLTAMSPRSILSDVEGKDVLCLACGGGQQSAVFGLLGAKVTVVDLAEGQLEGDRKAAAHHGYNIDTVHADMRDLSMLNDEAFDLVYGTAVVYVPDVGKVYREVARVMRPGALYRTDWRQPAIDFVAWDGSGYRITEPYAQKTNRREDGAIEFRHYMDDIFNGLIEAGMSVQQVEDLSRDATSDTQATPGSWTHEEAYVGGWRFCCCGAEGTRLGPSPPREARDLRQSSPGGRGG